MLSQPTFAKEGIRGSIVMIASAAASHTCPGHMLTAYGGSKGFVKSFSMQLGHELATTGIRVNSISPG
jgi:sorbose reductase